MASGGKPPVRPSVVHLRERPYSSLGIPTPKPARERTQHCPRPARHARREPIHQEPLELNTFADAAVANDAAPASVAPPAAPGHPDGGCSPTRKRSTSRSGSRRASAMPCRRCSGRPHAAVPAPGPRGRAARRTGACPRSSCATRTRRRRHPRGHRAPRALLERAAARPPPPRRPRRGDARAPQASPHARRGGARRRALRALGLRSPLARASGAGGRRAHAPCLRARRDATPSEPCTSSSAPTSASS